MKLVPVSYYYLLSVLTCSSSIGHIHEFHLPAYWLGKHPRDFLAKTC